METVNESSILLFLSLIGFVFVITLIFNGKRIIEVITDKKFNDESFLSKIVDLLCKTKIILLKVCGASEEEIDSKNNYLKADKIRSTYFLMNKVKCMWQLFTYYMFYSLLLVTLTRPINPYLSNDLNNLIDYTVSLNAPFQIFNLIILALCNVITDICSLTFTFVHLNKISKAFRYKNYSKVILWVIIDVFIALTFFVLVQIISNHLYPLSIENPPMDYNPWSIEATLKPYAIIFGAVDGTRVFLPFTFPGQLLITGTVFLPTFICMLFIGVGGLIFLCIQIFQKIFFKYDYSYYNTPSPLAGFNPPNSQSKKNKYTKIAAKFLITLLNGVIASIIAVAIMRILGWP